MNDERINRILGKLEEKAAKRSGHHPPAWNPSESGAVLVGEVVEFTKAVPVGNDDASDVATIEVPSGDQFSLWLNRTVLRREWERLSPQVGAMIGVQYHGMVGVEDGYDYHHYSVVAEKSPAGESNERKGSDRVDEALDNFDREIDAEDLPPPGPDQGQNQRKTQRGQAPF